MSSSATDAAGERYVWRKEDDGWFYIIDTIAGVDLFRVGHEYTAQQAIGVLNILWTRLAAETRRREEAAGNIRAAYKYLSENNYGAVAKLLKMASAALTSPAKSEVASEGAAND